MWNWPFFWFSKPNLGDLPSFLSSSRFPKFWSRNFMYFRHKHVKIWNQYKLLISKVSHTLKARHYPLNHWNRNTRYFVIRIVVLAWFWAEKHEFDFPLSKKILYCERSLDRRSLFSFAVFLNFWKAILGESWDLVLERYWQVFWIQASTCLVKI